MQRKDVSHHHSWGLIFQFHCRSDNIGLKFPVPNDGGTIIWEDNKTSPALNTAWILCIFVSPQASKVCVHKTFDFELVVVMDWIENKALFLVPFKFWPIGSRALS
jgi:hypothetical protein